MTTPLHAAANWYPDPLGRGEYRYWDGERWTQWIANGGVSRPDTFDLPDGLPEPSLLSAPPAGSPAPMPGLARYPRYDTLRFRTLGGLTTALTWLLAAASVSALAVAVATANHLSKIETFFDNPTFTTVHDANDAADVANAIDFILEAISLAIFVLLIMFLFRASKNTELWDTSQRTWTPGWAIGGWFIPLAFFVIPFLVVRDIWQRTPESSGEGRGPGSASGFVLVVWWVLFVIGRIGIRLGLSPDTSSEHRVEDWVHIVAAVTLAISAAALIVIVRDLARRQRATAFPDS